MTVDRRIPNHGPASAKVMIIGEAPGADEVREGRPFVGYSGKLLRECLAAAGIDPEAVYYANLCQFRPPGNELRKFFDRKGIPNSQVMDGLTLLQADIARVQPNILVPVGSFPLKFLTGRGKWKPDTGFTGISDFRSYIFEGTALAGGRKCLPTYHPAAATRDYSLKHLIQFDLGKVAREQHSAAILRADHFILVDPKGADKALWSQWLVSSPGTPSPGFRFASDPPDSPLRSVPAGDFLSADIEYIGANLLCLGATRHRDVAIVFPTRSFAEIEHVRGIVLSGVPLCFQNGMFDCSILEWHFDMNVTKYLRHDTMLMMHASYTEFPKDLGFIGSLHTDWHCWWEGINDEYWKGVKKGLRPVSECYVYNGGDVCVTHESAEKMLADELTDPVIRSNYEFKMDLIRPLWRIGRRGCRIDETAMSRLNATLTSESDLISQGIGVKFHGNPDFNPKSGNQVSHLLYDVLDVPRGPKTAPTPRFPDGQWKMDDTTLADLSLKARNDNQRLAIRMVRDARERLDLISKFCNIDLDSDRRMRCHYDPAKTVTDRLSSRIFYPTGNGANLQNVPRDSRVRACFVPDPGYIFCYADLKSAESLVVAHITGDPEMLRLHSAEYMSGALDGHKYVASFLLDKDITRLTKDERYLGKRVRHAGNYGLSWAKLQKLINTDAAKTGVTVTAAQSKRLIEKYRQLHFMLPSWWANVERTLWETHTISSLHGRKRVFYGRVSEILPEAIAFNPQCTVGQTLNMGLARIDPDYATDSDDLTWMQRWDRDHLSLEEQIQLITDSEMVNALGLEMLLQVHDAIGFQVPEQFADEILPRVQRLMAVPIQINRRGVEPYTITIPVDIQVGYNWGEFDPKKPQENPNGLKPWKQLASA